MPQTHLTNIRFDSFDLDPRILQGLADAGFTHCTPIQAQALPLALAGQDVAGQAQTGTGKTAAFLVAAMQHLLTHPIDPREPPQPRVVILAPTRELAVQIHRDAEVLGKHIDFKLGLVFGGTGYQEQRDALTAGVDILIGTPGRFIDYYKQRVFDFKSVQVVVLDEADRMFDLGFIKDIRFVLRRLPSPAERLGMLFSATLSYRVTELAYEHMNDPQMVEIAPEQVTAERVQQTCYMVANEEKIPLLLGLVRSLEDGRIMVFVNTKREGERVWGYLEGNGVQAAMLSGDVPQKKRLKLLAQFTSGELAVMVATDVAARGLHIPGVSHVINYDLPDDAEDYVHRIGRTARAGEAGDAISFVCETYAFCLPDIEAYIGMKIPVGAITTDMLAEVDPKSRVPAPRRPRDDRGPGGRRPGRDRFGRERSSAHGHHDKPRRGKHGATGEQRQERPAIQAEQTGPDKEKKRRRRRRKPAADSAPAG
jgi:ATP-dependent RNA helicase RhlB